MKKLPRAIKNSRPNIPAIMPVMIPNMRRLYDQGTIYYDMKPNIQKTCNKSNEMRKKQNDITNRCAMFRTLNRIYVNVNNIRMMKHTIVEY